MNRSVEILSKLDELMIEVEVPIQFEHQRKVQRFYEQFSDLTGKDIRNKVSRVRNAGVKCIFYFNALERTVEALAEQGYCVCPSQSRGFMRPQYQYRLYSNHLFWLMVGNGFDVGVSGKTEVVTSIDVKPALSFEEANSILSMLKMDGNSGFLIQTSKGWIVQTPQLKQIRSLDDLMAMAA